MRRLPMTIVLVGVLSMPAMAFAQNGGDNETEASETTTYEFEADGFEGITLAPDPPPIESDEHVKHTELIDTRPDFVPEMLETVEDL